MLLHQDNKFIYNNIAAIKIPNNVYLDPSPDPCPIEGRVLYTKDLWQIASQASIVQRSLIAVAFNK